MRSLDSTGTASSLKKMLSEATVALGRLDSERLEEIARSCEELTRVSDRNEIKLLGSSAEMMRPEVRIFNRTLQATATNRKILLCLQGCGERLEYCSTWNGALCALEGSDAVY
jgi:hypothetical protein